MVDVVVVEVPSPVTVVTVQVPGIQGNPGSMTGPASATDNAIARFDGTTGTLVQNSLVTIDDNGKINGVAGSTAAASINVPHGVAPSAPVNGDFWSTTAAFFGRLNGATQTIMTLAGGTMTGLIATIASATGGSGLRIPHGVAPSAPVNGDIWSTTAAFFGRLNGTTVQFAVITDISGVYMPLSGGTFTGKVTMFTSASGNASMTLPHGVAPSAPVNGDFWTTTAALFVRLNGTTQTVMTLAGGTMTGKITTLASASGGAGLNVPHGAAPSAPVNGDIWSTTAAFFVQINGATQTLATATDLALKANLASPTFTGTPAAPTPTAGDSSTQIATTAFVNTETENAQSGTTYTLVLSDIGKMVSGNNAAAITFTIPTNATTAFPIGTRIDVVQLGAGQITISGAGVTIRSLNTLTKTAGQYAGVTLWKQGTNTWHLFGQLG